MDTGNSEPWSAPPVVLEPPFGRVHVWRALLDVAPSNRSFLSEDEQERADRLVHAQHRHRFIAMRAAVRAVLGRYLRIAPESLKFAYGEKGKPSVANGQNSLDLRFNVSHSGGLGLLAVTCGAEIGVDVETRQQVVDFMAVARRFLSMREYRDLSALQDEFRQRAFLRCWTRKESYVKALGQGLACSLQSFSVSVSPEISNDCLLETDFARIHYISDIALPDEGFASVAVEGEGRPRCCWTYHGE